MPFFNPAFLTFFRELSANNTSEWFNEHRKTYEKEVKKPFADFVAEMITRIQEYEPDVQIKPADAIMRINKDIRFSKDKTPYNTHVAANISVYGKKDKGYPGFYFQLSQEGVRLFGGAYMVETPVLQQIRNYITANLSEFKDTYSGPEFKKHFGQIQGEQAKRLTPELQQAVKEEPLIANKQFYYSAALEPEIITAENLPDRLMEYYRAGKPVNDFLKNAFAAN